MENPEPKKHFPFIIAVAVALVVAMYYFASGQGSLSTNVRELEKSSTIQKVESTGSNTVTVKCKNGDSYEIVYQAGQTNYQDLVYNKCGEGV